jgi:hypothetical protein
MTEAAVRRAEAAAASREAHGTNCLPAAQGPEAMAPVNVRHATLVLSDGGSWPWGGLPCNRPAGANRFKRGFFPQPSAAAPHPPTAPQLAASLLTQRTKGLFRRRVTPSMRPRAVRMRCAPQKVLYVLRAPRGASWFGKYKVRKRAAAAPVTAPHLTTACRSPPKGQPRTISALLKKFRRPRTRIRTERGGREEEEVGGGRPLPGLAGKDQAAPASLFVAERKGRPLRPPAPRMQKRKRKARQSSPENVQSVPSAKGAEALGRINLKSATRQGCCFV